jgi:hypothetical protein
LTGDASLQPSVILDADEMLDFLLYSEEAPWEPTLDYLSTALIRVGRNHGPRIVDELYCNGKPTRQAAAVLVPDVWSMVEFPLNALGRDDWRWLFNFAGYTYNGKRRARPVSPASSTAGPTRHTGMVGRGPTILRPLSGSPTGPSMA